MGPHDRGKFFCLLLPFTFALCYLYRADCVITSEDSLGGELLWAAGVSVVGDIPFKPHWPVKLHGFVNMGRLNQYDHCAFPIHTQPNEILISYSLLPQQQNRSHNKCSNPSKNLHLQLG